MHGIINRGLQNYICDLHSSALWEAVCRKAGLSFYNFEAMLPYKDTVTDDLIAAICDLLDRTPSDILEDFGTYVVSSKAKGPMRALLRLSGDTYTEFLSALEDFMDRTTLAIPAITLPQITVENEGAEFSIYTAQDTLGMHTFYAGVLRAMADDYGALAMIDAQDNHIKVHILADNWTDIDTLETTHA